MNGRNSHPRGFHIKHPTLIVEGQRSADVRTRTPPVPPLDKRIYYW